MSIGQGHGIEGRYAGLPDPYANANTSKIVILPVPFDKTSTYLQGSDTGPAALIEASRNMELYDIETESEVYLNGIYTDKPIEARAAEEMLQKTQDRVKEWIQKGKFVVTLGGEHTISYAPIKAHAEHYGRLTVLQLDAHTDLMPIYEDNPWSHACVMARVREIPQVEDVVAVGIRSMSSEELPYIDQSKVFFAHALEEDWIEQVLHELQDPVYITIDLDVFDSSLMPSTGTPEPGGLSWNQTLRLLKQVFLQRKVVGFDVVELCPNKQNVAPDYLAAKLIYQLLSTQFKA